MRHATPLYVYYVRTHADVYTTKQSKKDKQNSNIHTQIQQERTKTKNQHNILFVADG